MPRRYIKDEGAKRLHKYVYKGSDQSLTYKYLLSPLAELGIYFVPAWVAPNLLTYLGHLFTLAVYLIPIWECGWGLHCPLSRQSGLITTLCYFAWVLLDNMDGKQARRTLTSSPLGLLFDHQVDSLVVTIASTYLGSIALFGASTETIYSWVFAAGAFFFATWEELCLGVMDFPIINGACDGVLLLGFVSLLITVMSPELFSTFEIGGRSLRATLFQIFIVASLVSGVFNFVRVVYNSKDRLKSVRWTAAFFYYVGALYFIVNYSPSLVHISHTRELLIAFGFCFAHEVAMIQLAHCTDSDYTPIALPSRLVVGGIIVNTLVHCLGYAVLAEGLVVQALAVGSGLMYVYMAYFVANEMAEELGICIFTIPPPKTE
jgi:ethanolaminephosphotransferase